MAGPTYYDDDDDAPGVNHFEAPRHERLIGGLLWFFDAVRFWVTWPLHAVTRPFWIIVDVAVGLWDRARHRVGQAWYGSLFRVADTLKVDEVRESVRGRVHQIQATAAQSVDQITGTVAEKSVGPIHRAFGKLGQGLSLLAVNWFEFLDRAQQSPVLNLLTTPLRWTTFLGRDLADFAISWFFTRHYRQLLLGIPAFLMMMPLAYCAVRLPFHNSAAKAKHYRRAANAAIVAEDRDSAELYFRKLTQLGHMHEHVVYRTAILAQEKGSVDEAYEKMKQISDLQGKGTPLAEAHIWVAQTIVSGELEQDHPNPSELIVAHLRRAHELMPEEPLIPIMLSETLARDGKNEEALALLETVPESAMDDRARVRLMNLRLLTGDTAAIAMSSELADNYERRQERGDELTPLDYLNWASFSEMRQTPRQAARILLEAAEKFPDDEEVKKTVRMVAMPYVDSLPLASIEDAQIKIELLKLAIPLMDDPEPPMSALANMGTISNLAADVDELMKGYAAEFGELPANTLKIMGDTEIRNGNAQEARRLYTQAVQKQSDHHVALNNLAYLVATTPPVDLSAALQWSNKAVAGDPNNPHYLETRGQIYVKLGRWRDAIEDLSIALNGMPDKLEIHESLSQCYEEIGDPRAAQFHKARAKR